MRNASATGVPAAKRLFLQPLAPLVRPGAFLFSQAGPRFGLKLLPIVDLPTLVSFNYNKKEEALNCDLLFRFRETNALMVLPAVYHKGHWKLGGM